ncbi:hypothetical protein BDB01DRAFT_744682 [Pilobolus umbonatus]|nr:hypothetical protein BDB01DRAFT_744682 [Pilobolus umbonatus]
MSHFIKPLIDPNTPLIVGQLRIQVLECFLNVKVKRPYLIITLGDQQCQTSVAETTDITWSEIFNLGFNFHAQLFGTIQLDLYDSFTLYPDKHVGRCEIRLRYLESMPEVFDSYYELWDKKLSSGATTIINRERTSLNNVGALKLRISHQFYNAQTLDQGTNIGELSQLKTTPHSSTNLITEEELNADLKRHMKYKKQRPDTEEVVALSLYEQEDHPPPIQPDHSDDEEFGELIGASKESITSRHLEHETKSLDKQWRMNDGVMNAVESIPGTMEISQVIRTITKLLASFGQGFEMTNKEILVGLSVLDKFYSELPKETSNNLVMDLSEIDTAARYWKFSIASYGWKGLNLIGKGNGILSDAMREHSDAKSIIEFLSIPKDDLLAYEFRSVEAFRPSYFIARDQFTNSIVLSIRGTMSVMDTITDLVCEYEPWKGGFIHSGMKNSAMWFFRNVVPQLKAFCHQYSSNSLVIVGHSLGASTAAILTIILTDYIHEFQGDHEDPFSLQCYNYAPACGLSLDLAEKYKDRIQSFVFADDIVSKLSYGSMMYVKEMIIASAVAAQNMSLSDILWPGKVDDRWKGIFEQIAITRKLCINSSENPRLYVAGKIYQFWLDPVTKKDTRIVLERTSARSVSDELVVKKSILLDHLPSNFDMAFRKARETIMIEGALIK